MKIKSKLSPIRKGISFALALSVVAAALALSAVFATVPLLFGPAAVTLTAAAAPKKSGDTRWRDLPHTDTAFVPKHYRSRAEWERRRAHLRKQILWAGGLWPMPAKTPLNPRVFGRITHDDYVVEKVCFESYPGLYVCGNLYRPRQTSPRGHPGVLNPHGHAKTGRLHDDEIASYQARCITFARMGYVAFMWDMVDYNDSARQLTGTYQATNYWTVHNEPWKPGRHRRALWNINAFGLQLWNSIRALDFLTSLPEVDPERLASTGESGGGTQTFMLYAVDDRLKAAAPVCMVSAYMQGGCNCENAPGLRFDTHNVEIGAMMAPKPLQVISVSRDWTKHTAAVELPALQAVYALYGAADKLRHVHFDAQHGYNLSMREAVYPWLARWLSVPGGEDFKEPAYQKERDQDLLAFLDGPPSGAIKSHAELIQKRVEATERMLEEHRPGSFRQFQESRRLLGEGLRLSTGITRTDRLRHGRFRNRRCDRRPRPKSSPRQHAPF